MNAVGGQYQYTYEGTCPKCKKMWQLIDIIAERDEEFEDVPEECEDIDCVGSCPCPKSDAEKRDIDCPYI
jgi:predicted  nucleic acid-binding Zn ribbon protein